jgi:hypothetical protein
VSKLEGDTKAYVETLIPILKEGGAKAAELAAKVSAQFGDLPAPKMTGPIVTDIDCDECGEPMLIRQGRRGPFLGCSKYPKCKNTGEVPKELLEEHGLVDDTDTKETAEPEPAPEPQEHEDAA